MSTRWTLLIVFLLGISISLVESTENDGVLNKIKTGLQYAKSYLDTAKEIADLVSNSLGHKHVNERRGDDGEKPNKNPRDSAIPNLISGFFRLLGFDSPRISAIAVNSVIFLAQMVETPVSAQLHEKHKKCASASLFDVKPQLEETRSRAKDSPFDPLKFIVGNKNNRIQSLLHQAQDPTLPDQLIDRLDGYDSSCAKLLMCKSSPIILAAQSSLKNKTAGRKLDITSWLPARETFEQNGDDCEDKFRECALFPESV